MVGGGGKSLILRYARYAPDLLIHLRYIYQTLTVITTAVNKDSAVYDEYG